jgi:hypothetical protein
VDLQDDRSEATLHAELEARYAEFKEKRRQRVEDLDKVRAHGRELYRDGSGNLALRDSIAAFIDELGFSQRVMRLTDDELCDDIVLYDDVRLRLSNPAHISDDALRVVYFSDNVGIGMPLTDLYRSNDLSTVLGVVAQYQLNLALKGRFVRGGITRGMLYADHSFITGEALVRAVMLEKDKAIFPRVLLDEQCAELAMRDFEGSSQEPGGPLFFFRLADANNLLLRQAEHVFVSYLGVMLLDEYEDAPIDLLLRTHRDQIKKALAAPGQDARIAAKFKWAADYHDFFVTQVVWKPEWRIGSEQSHHFTSFNLDWMRASLAQLPITELLLNNFEHICARTDVPRNIPGSAHDQPVDVSQIMRTLVRSIEDECQLLSPEHSGAGPSEALSDLVSECRSVLTSMPAAVLQLDSLEQDSALDALWALDKGLRVIRVDARADAVARQALTAVRELSSKPS